MTNLELGGCVGKLLDEPLIDATLDVYAVCSEAMLAGGGFADAATDCHIQLHILEKQKRRGLGQQDPINFCEAGERESTNRSVLEEAPG